MIALVLVVLAVANGQLSSSPNTACPAFTNGFSEIDVSACDRNDPSFVCPEGCREVRVEAGSSSQTSVVCYTIDGTTWVRDEFRFCQFGNNPVSTTTRDATTTTTTTRDVTATTTKDTTTTTTTRDTTTTTTKAGQTPSPTPSRTEPTSSTSTTKPTSTSRTDTTTTKPPTPVYTISPTLPPCDCPSGHYCQFDLTRIIGCPTVCVCPTISGDPSTCRFTSRSDPTQTECDPKPTVCPTLECTEKPAGTGCVRRVGADGCPTCEFDCACNCERDEICQRSSTGAYTCVPKPACRPGATRPAASCPHGLVDTCNDQGQWVASRQVCPEPTCPPVTSSQCRIKPGCYYLDNVAAPGRCPDPCSGLYCPPTACEKPCGINEDCVMPADFTVASGAVGDITNSLSLMRPECRCREGSSYENRAGEKCTCTNGRNVCEAPSTPAPCDPAATVRVGCNECPCGADGRRFCLAKPCLTCSGNAPDVPAGACYTFRCEGGRYVRVAADNCIEPPPAPIVDPAPQPCWKCEAVVADAQASGSATSLTIASRPLECVLVRDTCPPLTQCDRVSWSSVNSFSIEALKTSLAADAQVRSHVVFARPDGSVNAIVCQKLEEDEESKPLPPTMEQSYTPESRVRIGTTTRQAGSSASIIGVSALALLLAALMF